MQSNNNISSSSTSSGHPFVRLVQNMWYGFAKRTTSFARSISTMSTVSYNMSHAGDNRMVTLQAPPSPRAGEGMNLAEAYLNPFDLAPHLVAVGAGPVDLIKLIRLKTLAPQAVLLVIERNEVYIRGHTLRLVIDRILNEDLKQIILASPQGKLRKGIVYIRAQELEKILSDYAKEIGIIFHYEKVVSREQLEMAFPDCKKIVFGDGAHSSMRQKVFGPDAEFISEHPMQNVLQIQYTVKGERKALEFWVLEASEKLSEFLFEETVTYNAEKDETRIAARFFLDEVTNRAVPDGKEKQPIALTADMPLSVKKAISIFLNTRNDGPIDNALLTKIKLSAYTSKIYVKNENHKSWLLIGDAAFGVPYFRSLNAGIICANTVAEIFANNLIASNYAHKQLSGWELVRINAFMLHRFTHELTRAAFKDWGLDATKSAIYSVASVPMSMQLNRWHRVDRQRLKAMHPIFGGANDHGFDAALSQRRPESSFASSRNILFSPAEGKEEKDTAVVVHRPRTPTSSG